MKATKPKINDQPDSEGEFENPKPRTSIDSVYSSAGESTSAQADLNDSKNKSTDAASVSEEDEFSQLKTRSTARSKRARQLPDLASDSEAGSQHISQRQPRKPSDSQYSSDDSSQLKTRKTAKGKRARRLPSDATDCSDESNDSKDDSQYSSKDSTTKNENSDDGTVSCSNSSQESREISPPRTRNASKRYQARKRSSVDTSKNTRKKRKCTKRKNSRDTSSSEESDSSEKSSQEESQTSQSETSSTDGRKRSREWSITTDEGDGFIVDGNESDSSQMEEPDVTPKKSKSTKYKNVRVCSDSTSEEEEEEEDEKGKQSPSVSPKKIENQHILDYKHKRLISVVGLGKKDKVRDIIIDKYEDLVSPAFSDLLWLAVNQNKDPEIASMLVDARVDVNCRRSKDGLKNTVLHVIAEKASREKYEQFAISLMNSGAHINVCNAEGNSILWSAVKGGSVKVVEELMRRGVKIDENYNRILRVAVENCNNSANILPLLIKYKAPNIVEEDERALYALRCLVKAGGDLAAMKVLLDRTLDLNDDFEDSTLLHTAVIDFKVGMVKLLLEYGANPSRKRMDGSLPLWHAARLPTSEISALLIKHGANVNDCNDSGPHAGQYPLHAACNAGIYGSAENVKLLLHFGADVQVTDSRHNWTPFTNINNNDIKDTNKLMIQQFALLTSKQIAINARDMKKIKTFPMMRKYYANCCGELQRLKRLTIFGDVTVYDLLNYDVKKISHLIKNTDLIDEYHKNRTIIKETAPMFSTVIHKRMKIAWTRRDKLSSIEIAIREASNNVLPEDVCEKIAYLVCYECLKDMELKELL